MNIRNIHILRTLAALLLCAAVVSCSQDELGVEHGEPLPPGKYPLMFTATVDGMTSRAAETEQWRDGDEIAVQIDDYPVIGRYMLNANGSVKECDEPLSWPYEDGYVMAWYPYFDFGKTLTPTIDDQSEGYHGIDFLAAVSEKKENYKNTVGLTFKHQMAKVRCMLYKGDGVTEEDIKTAKVSYFGYTKAEFSKAGLSGDENGWITPTEDFTALLVPQDMSGRPFIEVELTVKVNGVSIDKTLTYTPEQGSGNLEAGKAYTYKITVQKDRLVAQTVSGQWNDDNGSEDADQVRRRVNLNIPEGNELNLSFSDNVEPVSGDTRAGSNPEYLLVKGKEFTISYSISGNSSTKGIIPSVRDEANITMTRSLSKGVYTFQYTLKSQPEVTVGLDYADYVQIGDIYFSDGTWSSDTIEGKNPIGIVFKTDTIGTGDKPDNYGWVSDRRIRGYVVALEDASDDK